MRRLHPDESVEEHHARFSSIALEACDGKCCPFCLDAAARSGRSVRRRAFETLAPRGSGGATSDVGGHAVCSVAVSVPTVELLPRPFLLVRGEPDRTVLTA